MAEIANPGVKAPQAAAAPIEARMAAIQATRDRMSGNLSVLEQKVRNAVGIRDHAVTSSAGERRKVTLVTAAVTAHRLWALPFWRLTAISAATAGLVAFGVWRSRRATHALIEK